jgi:hypothetical protein
MYLGANELTLGKALRLMLVRWGRFLRIAGVISDGPGMLLKRMNKFLTVLALYLACRR